MSVNFMPGIFSQPVLALALALTPVTSTSSSSSMQQCAQSMRVQ